MIQDHPAEGKMNNLLFELILVYLLSRVALDMVTVQCEAAKISIDIVLPCHYKHQVVLKRIITTFFPRGVLSRKQQDGVDDLEGYIVRW